MASHVLNHLTILVPTAFAEGLKASMHGPRSWAEPAVVAYAWMKPKLSNHQIISIDAEAEKLIAQFRAMPCNAFYPEWMPVSRRDIEIMLSCPEKLEPEISPFSVPALHPWKDRAEFDHYYPGVMEGPYWNMPEGDHRILHGEKGWAEHSECLTGVDRPPFEAHMTQSDAADDLVRLVITYRTRWTPMRDLDAIIGPTLKRHHAKAYLIWAEDSGLSGYDFIDPERDIAEVVHFDRDHAVEIVDDDGVSFEVDLAAVQIRALEDIDDHDF